MKDNIEFYIQFIEEIEKNPILYNHGITDYSNKHITKNIWNTIGEKFNEKGEDCKTKWKSIRSAYIRSLNIKYRSGSAAGSKKEYYLAPYLQFLNPFVRHRTQETNIGLPQEDEHHNLVDSEYGTHIEETSNNEPALLYPDEDSLSNEEAVVNLSVPSPHSSLSIEIPQSSKSRVNEADKCVIEYFKLKKQEMENKQQTKKQQKDPMELFLLSLVPHLTSMTQQQQLAFQKGALDLIDNIKYRQDPPS